MKISTKGKEKLINAIKLNLDAEKSGAPRDMIEHMLMYWVVGLLENQTEELIKELEEQ